MLPSDWEVEIGGKVNFDVYVNVLMLMCSQVDVYALVCSCVYVLKCWCVGVLMR